MKPKLVFAALIVFTCLGFAAPASAHATLDSTTPASGATLQTAPRSVSLQFNESVEASLGAIRVFDDTGKRVDEGKPVHPSGDSSKVEVGTDNLKRGAYVVTWRVISADSHPVHGAFTFDVGAGDENKASALSERLVASDGGSVDVGVVFAIARAVIFGSLIVGVGALAFMAWLAPADGLARRVRRIGAAAFGVLGIVSVASIALQGLYGSAMSLTHIVNVSLFADTIRTRYGFAAAVRVLLCAVLVWLLTKRPAIAPRRFAFVGFVIVATITAAGHGATGRYVPLGALLDVVHVATVSTWIGGLVVLAFVVLATRDADDDEHLPEKFSRLALRCVVIITVTGTIQGWRQLSTWNALFHSDYGHLLIIKVCLFIAIVGVAWLSRRNVQKRAHDAGRAFKSRLRRSVGVEIALAVGVIAVTSILVNSAPASSTSKVFSAQTAIGNTMVNVVVEPARAGTNSIHLYTLTPAGLPVDVPEMQLAMTLADKDIGPIQVPLTPVGQGHDASYGTALPIAGDWRADITVRTSDIDSSTGSISIPIH